MTASLAAHAAAVAAAIEAPRLCVENVSKCFGGATVLDGVSFALGQGQTLALLGPSGSGKSTLLNLIAGFEQPDVGDIALQGRSVSNEPAYRRRIGVVFQNYALFPHLSVGENVAYGLRRDGLGRAAIEARVARMLQLTQLDALRHRPVSALSGGQQQRVAIARALAPEPQVLLMDEPLGALDRTLREALQIELKVLLQQIGATVVYVTHDQGEALALADTIAVLNRGRIEQIADGETVYARPASAFVARFLTGARGLAATILTPPRTDGTLSVQIAGAALPGVWLDALHADAGTPAEVVVRPEQIEIEAAASQASGLSARVVATLFAGNHRTIQLQLADSTSLTARASVTALWRAGQDVRISWPATAASVYRRDTR